MVYIHSLIGSLEVDDHSDTGVQYHILLSSDTTKITKNRQVKVINP